jgi:hypothetical protein
MCRVLIHMTSHMKLGIAQLIPGECSIFLWLRCVSLMTVMNKGARRFCALATAGTLPPSRAKRLVMGPLALGWSRAAGAGYPSTGTAHGRGGNALIPHCVRTPSVFLRLSRLFASWRKGFLRRSAPNEQNSGMTSVNGVAPASFSSYTAPQGHSNPSLPLRSHHIRLLHYCSNSPMAGALPAAPMLVSMPR